MCIDLHSIAQLVSILHVGYLKLVQVYLLLFQISLLFIYSLLLNLLLLFIYFIDLIASFNVLSSQGP